ncbi:GNAT family N-acetyltransferase [Lysobacter sp. F6437]|uniref:GNAT family N-acetyltransferase n=1 Tax=Lysobacter sp. F6437 TaxID=3459296 RepID=UPI00403DE459
MTPLTAFDPANAGHPANQLLTVRTVVGEAIGAHAADIARLRLAVFREWPCLLEDGAGGEDRHLQACTGSWRSLAVLVFDAGTLVGASTGLPLADAAEPIRQPFAAAGVDIQQVFHCGGSALLPAYRGRGLGHRFFDERESHARMLGDFDQIAFCAVDRAADHPRRPPFGRGNEAFWQRRGYRPRTDLKVAMDWNEAGEGRVAHTLTPWFRPLERMR